MLWLELHLHRHVYTPDPATDPPLALQSNFESSSMPIMVNMFLLFGLPTDDNFPDFFKLPYAHFAFPNWTTPQLEPLLAGLPDSVRKLARDMLQYSAAARASAGELLTRLH